VTINPTRTGPPFRVIIPPRALPDPCAIADPVKNPPADCPARLPLARRGLAPRNRFSRERGFAERGRALYDRSTRTPDQGAAGGLMSEILFPEPDAGVLARRDQILSDLAALLPAECLIASEDERRAFETDALTAYRRLPLAVALPQDTAQVSALLRYCSQAGVKVVPRGAGTSLSGGAIPQEDALVIGVSKMNRILDVNLADRTIRVQAGVTNLAVSEAVAPDGFFYAPDPSSQLACTIAGNIGMNSGGAHCLKYGVTTNNVLGAKLVLMNGEVVELGGASFDAPGLDLLGVLVGSEGQLGIVTEAVLRLVRAAEGARPVLFGFDSSEAAGACVAAIIGAGIVPVAMEFMDRPAIRICEAFAKAGYPLDVEAMLIIEVEGSEAEMDAELARIVEIARAHDVRVVKESRSAMETALIWKGRKSAFGATGRVADYICMDGTVPTGQLPYVLKRTAEIVASYGLGVANVFHAGDGNMHPLIMYDVNDPASQAKAEAAGMDILRLCVDAGGCLTGEHGVGVEKRDLMRHQFSQADLEQQMRVRAAFDPQWLLNPAKVFPLDGRVSG
jgi:glycolate oxidase